MPGKPEYPYDRKVFLRPRIRRGIRDYYRAYLAILGISPKTFIGHFLLITSGSLFFSLLAITLFFLPERPDKGQEVFSFLLVPMTFFGCTRYSYAMLRPPFNYIALMLPTTYISEGLRAAYNPDLPHIDTGLTLMGLFSGVAVLNPARRKGPCGDSSPRRCRSWCRWGG